MARLPDVAEPFTPQTQEVYDELVSSRGALRGPYRALLHDPELARRVGALGGFLRFGGGCLPGDVREIVVLAVARRLGSAFEWAMHEPHALSEGIRQDVIEALRAGREPSGLSPLQAEALEAAGYVLDGRSIPRDLQDGLAARLGLKGVVELVVLAGFYEMIARIISSFDVPLPAGTSDPFPVPGA